MRQNLHTHSTYCDGKNTLREMADAAVEKKFDILGFSGHGYVPSWDGSMSVEQTREYIKEVQQLKKEYAGQLKIFLGIEEDTEYRLLVKEPFDFVIGSVHSMFRSGVAIPVDWSRDVFEFILEMWFHGDFHAFAKEYFAQIREMKDWDEVDIIGHLDLISKFNEDEYFFRFDDPVYVKEAADTIDAFAGKKILEVNTGAISRGYRKTPYPAENLLRYMHEKGVQICLNSDCHSAPDLDCYFPESLEMIRRCGYTSMMILTDEGFKELPLEEFR